MATLVVALGGNAILQPKQVGTYEEQYENIRAACGAILHLIRQGHQVIITHGNGPQVGNVLIQNEEASVVTPAMPLHACVASTQGQLGYMLQHAMSEVLEQAGVQKSVVSVVTRTEVSPEDPAFSKPTKPIGPFYTPQRAKRLMSERGYEMIEDAGRGWRRVVPSPKPLRIVELGTIADLVKSGVVVIASGGGGIPVVRTPEGQLTGVDAVIDKDLAGARLARDLNADILMIFTDVERVALNWGTPEQKWLADVSLAEMKGYETEGHFKAGSMKPKVAAAVEFVESGAGRRAVIGRLQSADKVLAGETGTWISA
ncbi:MAG TPA: carbamate kinase [Symbiobacteriaceae bacterium]|jgi:carbamate kinase|nr:carbamate kinase [Symbiobacteriaceae bacterium]